MQVNGLIFVWRLDMNNLYVVSGFSGSGKGTILLESLKDKENIYYSVSETTRIPRNKTDRYVFVTDSVFKERARRGYYLESNTYGTGKYYGTPLDIVNLNLRNQKNVLLEIDRCGYEQVKRHRFIDNVNVRSLFVVVDADTLYERLMKRDGAENDQQEIYKRLKIALDEADYISQYDCILDNSGSVKEAVKKLDAFYNGKKHIDDFNCEKFKTRILEILKELSYE